MEKAYANEGVVANISQKPFTDHKTGQPIVLHSFQLQGSNRWFRTGREPLPANVGEFITFLNDAKANVDISSVRTGAVPPAPALSAPQPTSARAGKQPARQSSGTSRDDYWKEKENRDLEKDARYQSVDVPRMSFSASQERAVHLVAAALAHDALSFGSATKGKRLDMLLDYVDQVTDRFFLQSMGAHLRLASLEDSGYQFDDEQEDFGTNEGDY
jgi:hypothetical protein